MIPISSPNTPPAEPLLADGFLFRPFVEDDAAAFTEAVRESRTTVGQWMPWAHEAYSIKDALAWFKHCEEHRAQGSSHEFGIFDATTHTLVGGCGLNQFNTACGFCNLGYWVRESWQRKGAGLAAIQALTRYGFSRLQLGRIEIVVATDNIPSLSLAAKAGAVREGLARNRIKAGGRFMDAYVFSVIPESGS